MSQDDMAEVLGVTRAHYSKVENAKRSWTLEISTKWLTHVLSELDKLPEGTVDFSRVVDFHDLQYLNSITALSGWEWKS